MQQLDRWNKELERLSAASYREASSELYSFYKDALKQLKKEIKVYIENYETLSFSKRLEVEQQIAVARRIDEIIDFLNDNTNNSIRKQIESEIDRGYYGTWYALEGNENIQIDFPMLDERYVKRLVHSPVDGKTFSKRLYDHQSDLANKATNELLMGAVRGEGYEAVAKRVAEQTEASYKQALRIARTEGGRARSSAKQQAYRAAERKGVKLEKMWMATLDKKTRHSHRALDGQTVPVKGKFKHNGYYADGPRLFGVASQDINCRCTTIAVVNGLKPELRRDNETKKVIPYKSYNDWLKNTKKQAVDSLSDKKSINLNGIIRKIKPEHATEVINSLDKTPAKLRNVWNKFGDKIRLGDPDYKGGAHYRPSISGEGQVNMNMDKVINGTTFHAPMGTFFHEFGHNIDYLASEAKGGKGYHAYSSQFVSKKHEGYTLRDMIVEESNDYVTKTWNQLKDEAVASGLKRSDVKKYKAYSKIREELMELHYYDSDVADIWEGATNARVTGKLGHGKSYWKDDKNRVNKEAFAEMFGTSISRPESLEAIKKYFPKAHEIFEEMLDDIMKE